MELKKAICALWSHEFVAVPTSFSSRNEGQEHICRRCGEMKFSPTAVWEEQITAPEKNADVSFVKSRAEISRDFR